MLVVTQLIAITAGAHASSTSQGDMTCTRRQQWTAAFVTQGELVLYRATVKHRKCNHKPLSHAGRLNSRRASPEGLLMHSKACGEAIISNGVSLLQQDFMNVNLVSTIMFMSMACTWGGFWYCVLCRDHTESTYPLLVHILRARIAPQQGWGQPAQRKVCLTLQSHQHHVIKHVTC